MSYEFKMPTIQEFADHCWRAYNLDYLKVQLFCESVGLPTPSKVQTGKIQSISKTHLSKNPISFEVTGNTAAFELNDIEPFIEYFKKHKECKVLDIQHFSKVNNLIKFLEFVPNSQIEKIVISSELKDALKEEEQKAIIKAKTLKPSLQLGFVDNSKHETKPVPVKSPANNTNSAPSSPPHASVKPAAGSGNTTPNHSPTSSPLSTSPAKSEVKPPIPPIRVSGQQAQPPATESSEKIEKTLSSIQEKLSGLKIDNKPAYQLFLEILLIHKCTYQKGLHMLMERLVSTAGKKVNDGTNNEPQAERDLQKIESNKLDFKGKKVLGIPFEIVYDNYLNNNPSKTLSDAKQHIKYLINTKSAINDALKLLRENL